MEEKRSSSGSALGTAALITGVITFVLAVIPCIGVLAIVPGIVTIVLAAVALSQASRDRAPQGLIIGAFVIGILAFLISTSQLFIARNLGRNADRLIPSDIRKALEEVKEDISKVVLKDLEDAKINIKIESGDEKIEINATGTAKKDKLIEQLEVLEKGEKEKSDTLPGK